MTFVDFDICHRTASLRKLYSVTLTYFLKVNNFKCQHLRNGKSLRKHMRESLVDFHTCHLIASLRLLYSMTLTYFLKVIKIKILIYL